MSYRDDLAAAHARIDALETEVEKLRRRNEELEADAAIGREVRKLRDPNVPFDEDKLREKMRREAIEVEEKIRALRAEMTGERDDD